MDESINTKGSIGGVNQSSSLPMEAEEEKNKTVKEKNLKTLESFMKRQQISLSSVFQRMKKSSLEKESSNSSPSSIFQKPVPQLSALANAVVSSCSKILQVPTEELQHCFESQLPESVKERLTYARCFVEFCSFKALHQLSKEPNYLADQELRRLTYDMMLAWEAPSVESDKMQNQNHHKNVDSPSGPQESEDNDEWSLFYTSSTKMAIQVDDNKTVGPQAFARIATVCAPIADIITADNLFHALTNSSGQRLHFLVYDKYIRNLAKVFKNSKNLMASTVGNLPLCEGEIVLDVDGTIPTQPILQHIGMSAWPGRLTLTNYALYFESLGVGTYEKAVRYDLAADMKQMIKPEMTGPLGARLFDKAVMYKSASMTEAVYLEFPEFNRNSRRDYWLDISLEILHAHKFIRKYNLIDTQKSEVLARAILGIFRYRALREAFQVRSSHYKSLLAFNLAESLPRGDVILETLLSCMANLAVKSAQNGVLGTDAVKQQAVVSSSSLMALYRFGILLEKKENFHDDVIIIGDIRAGEISPLEMAVKRTFLDTGRAEAAQATVDQVKVEGIDTNLAIMKELLFPVIESAKQLQVLASWKNSYRSAVFLLFTCYMIIRGWIQYVLPSIFVFIAITMLWYSNFNAGRPIEAFRVTSPPNQNAVEQLLNLQEAITHVESAIQAGNVILLKIRALLFGLLPQATAKVAALLVFAATIVAFVPLKYIVMIVFVELFTRELPYRKRSSDRFIRRAREWWISIPAAPVQLERNIDKKKEKKKRN